jgi:hypothetical protein
MYGVMSRGYICPIVPAVVFDEKPVITGVGELAPTIDDASLGPQPGAPTIQGAQELSPEIQGAQGDPDPSPQDPPTITGGNLLAPIIQSGEED